MHAGDHTDRAADAPEACTYAVRNALWAAIGKSTPKQWMKRFILRRRSDSVLAGLDAPTGQKSWAAFAKAPTAGHHHSKTQTPIRVAARSLRRLRCAEENLNAPFWAAGCLKCLEIMPTPCRGPRSTSGYERTLANGFASHRAQQTGIS
ncbi:hypothetical protein OH77DRAFT_974976 [Trametes cingulata]|nr:hypothetical protein OH77DRAFT_974976 [Trametes cingulata]